MALYKVFYYNVANPEIIQANTHKEAAIIYYKKFPRTKDEWICVVEKGFRNRKNEMMYRTAELFPEKKWAESIGKKFDESKLDSFSLKLFKIMQKDHPNWLNNLFNCEICEQDKSSGFIIKISNPFQQYHPLEINTCSIEDEVVSFGLAWLDWYILGHYSNVSWSEWWKNDPKNLYESVEYVIDSIIEEELISVNARGATGVFYTREEYNLSLDMNTLIQAIS